MRTLVKTLPQSNPIRGDSDLARQAGRRLRSVLTHGRSERQSLGIQLKAKSGPIITIPVSAARVLVDVLEQMAQGRKVAALPMHSELTTQAAADLLQVSRPFLISQLEMGLIPFHTVGSHRRILLEDALAYKKQMNRRRLKTLSKLSALDQKLGLI